MAKETDFWSFVITLYFETLLENCSVWLVGWFVS